MLFIVLIFFRRFFLLQGKKLVVLYPEKGSIAETSEEK